jgi:hypothetical protein
MKNRSNAMGWIKVCALGLITLAAVPLCARGPVPGATLEGSIVRAIFEGAAAEARGDRQIMLKSANELARLGAEPLTDQPDLAARWRTSAQNATTRAAQTDAAAYRGRALGASYRMATLGPVQTFSSQQTFLAGQRASVSATVTDDARLMLRVTNGDGVDVCHAGFVMRTAQCTWVPISTDRSCVAVTNTEKRSINLVLLTN